MTLRGSAQHLFSKSLRRIRYGFRHDASPLARILDAEYFERRDPIITRCLEEVLGKKPIDGILRGFRGTDYDERIVEYTYFANWLQSCETGVDLLDVGCTLNHSLLTIVLDRYCRYIYFCNPAQEPLRIALPTFFHPSKLEHAFPHGETFAVVTSLSTIEHIGFDNSQYGSKEPSIYKEPTLEPLLEALRKLASLTATNGQLLISVPYGRREAVVHPVTRRIASQVFDFESLIRGIEVLAKAGIASELAVFESTDDGWEQVSEPRHCVRRYADGCPAAGAVAFISGQRTAEERS